MKKPVVLFYAAVLLMLSITGCSKTKKLDYDVIYYEAMAFGENTISDKSLSSC